MVLWGKWLNIGFNFLKGVNMFVLNVSYNKLPEVVAEHSATHGQWVKKYIDEGVFLCAGPKPSKLGGVILAKSISKARLLDIIKEDSFVIHDVAEYQILEFDCKLASIAFDSIKGE